MKNVRIEYSKKHNEHSVAGYLNENCIIELMTHKDEPSTVNISPTLSGRVSYVREVLELINNVFTRFEWVEKNC